MNHLFRILLLGALPLDLSRYPGVSAGTGYPDTTFSRTFLVHLRKSPGRIRAGNWEPQTLTRIKSGPWRTPRKSPCYATCTNFSAPRKTENRSRSMNSRTSHSGNGSPPTRKSSECLPYPGLGKQTLSIFYRIWNANNKTLRPVETSMALGAGLASNVIPPEECLSKFNFYRESYFQSACHPQADTMQPWEWAIVFRGRESLEDLSWAQQFIEKKQIPSRTGWK